MPGIVSATRYKLDKSIQPMPGITGDPRSYLAIYEVEGNTSEDLARFAQELRKRWTRAWPTSIRRSTW